MIIDFNGGFSIDIGNGTDVGRVRQQNEDYLEFFESKFGYVFIVCDGMGGHTAGEVASRMAVSAIKEHILNNPDVITSTKQIIVDAINTANNRILDKWNEEPELKGMGTTVVLLIVKSNIAYYGHVGDSRIYIVRNSKIYQLTKDHSFVQTLVDGGLISYEEAEKHPRKNEITQAIGINSDIRVDVNNIGLNLYKNDVIMLCTDGLTGLVEDKNIENIINKNPPQSASLKLIEAANNNGGHDNITVQIVKVVKGIQIPNGKDNEAPVGALDKTNASTNTNMFKPYQHENVSEETFSNSTKAKTRKSKTMIYLLLVVLIMIFGGLSYYVLNKSDENTKTLSIIENPRNKLLTYARSELTEYFKNTYSYENDFVKDFQYVKMDNILLVEQKGSTLRGYNYKMLKRYINDKKYVFKDCILDNTKDTLKDIQITYKVTFDGNITADLKGGIKDNKYEMIEINFYPKTDKRDEEREESIEDKRVHQDKRKVETKEKEQPRKKGNIQEKRQNEQNPNNPSKENNEPKNDKKKEKGNIIR